MTSSRPARVHPATGAWTAHGTGRGREDPGKPLHARQGRRDPARSQLPPAHPQMPSEHSSEAPRGRLSHIHERDLDSIKTRDRSIYPMSWNTGSLNRVRPAHTHTPAPEGAQQSSRCTDSAVRDISTPGTRSETGRPLPTSASWESSAPQSGQCAGSDRALGGRTAGRPALSALGQLPSGKESASHPLPAGPLSLHRPPLCPSHTGLSL